MILKIDLETSYECTLEKIDNEREGKPEQKFDAAFGAIFRINIVSFSDDEFVIGPCQSTATHDNDRK